MRIESTGRSDQYNVRLTDDEHGHTPSGDLQIAVHESSTPLLEGGA
ncbi:hypothetical protein [Haloparvum sedimenti]|nr:hypothetical protein [Haloparvum sedimenti]